MIRALFICSKNQWRRPTAEQIFATRQGVETNSAGLDESAVVLLSPEQIDWATHIFVMEIKHKRKLSQVFKKHLSGKKIILLGIPDRFQFMQEELVAQLKIKVEAYLR